MSKTIEFIEKLKDLLELDDVLCLTTDDDYKFLYNRLKMFQQIKTELEAWEVVKPNIVEEDIKVIKVKCQLYPKGESNGKYEKLKKAIEVKDE